MFGHGLLFDMYTDRLIPFGFRHGVGEPGRYGITPGTRYGGMCFIRTVTLTEITMWSFTITRSCTRTGCIRPFAQRLSRFKHVTRHPLITIGLHEQHKPSPPTVGMVTRRQFERALYMEEEPPEEQHARGEIKYYCD
jgi:hypothetical protein